MAQMLCIPRLYARLWNTVIPYGPVVGKGMHRTLHEILQNRASRIVTKCNDSDTALSNLK